MYIEFGCGTYGDPDFGGRVCSRKCLDIFLEEHDAGLADESELEVEDKEEIFCDVCRVALS